MRTPSASPWLAAALLAAGLALPARAQETPAPAEAEPPPAVAPDAAVPVATFQEFAHDFGEVSRGQKVRHAFVVRNDGKVDLEVLNVAPTCGCTVAQFDRIIPPGKEGTISALLDTTRFSGRITKGLTVKTNDPARPMAALQITGEVRAFVDVLPAWRASFTTDQGKPAQQVLYVKNMDPTFPLDLIGAISDNSHVSVKIQKIKSNETDADKGEFRLILDLEPDAPIGPVAGNVTVTTTHKRQRTVEIAIDGRVNGPIVYFPQSIVMYKDPDRRPQLGGTIVLQTRPDVPLEIGGTEADDPQMQIQQIGEPLNGQLRFALTWTDPEAKGLHEGKVRIKTGNSAMPLIEVPYQVRIK
jgi:hypothetical protein